MNKRDPDSFLRAMFGYDKPTRNDCGYPDRYNHEDTSRMHGWAIEGEGACDYPMGCIWYEDGVCQFHKHEGST